MQAKSLRVALLTSGVCIAAVLIVIYPVVSSWFFSTKVQPPRGIILISLDTLRADHLGIYGYHRNTSPYIDAFARENIIFENAVVQSSWTLPSHMSIMTSLYPSSHGVKSKEQRLAEDHVTLAELVQKGGYKTAAFADGAFMRKVYGFDKGFDLYDGDKRVGIAHILPKVKKWLDANKSNPFFLFIHCYDIHDPYTPPPPYDSIFHDFTYTGQFVPTTKNMQAAAWRRKVVTDQDLRHIKALYDGGIRYTDERIGRFLAYLEESGLQDKTLIIITSDHGEEFKEHGSFLHWKLYFRPNLHVPLIMHIPNFPKKGIRINELVESIDILPTILDTADLPPHEKAQGRTLLPIIKRNGTFFRRLWWQLFHFFSGGEKAAFAEHRESKGKKRHDYSIITDHYQMIYSLSPQANQLFNIKDDPQAENDIAKDRPAVVEHMMSQITSMYLVPPSYRAPQFILDEQTSEQLQALGYIDDVAQGSVTTDDSIDEGPHGNNSHPPSSANAPR
jgi:arylsulfatase A-like enzyme